MSSTEPMTYASAGVDVEAGDRAVELMKSAVSATHGAQVLSGVGGFAGMFDISAFRNYRRPLLATSTDGVGTKIAVARSLGIHDTIGQDLVAMVVDDLVVSGAEPLFMTDYIACGSVHPERIADIVRGIAQGCSMAGCALVGGETAEHPGLMAPDEYDVAGAATGIVDADDLLGPDRVEVGDIAIAMAASGLHSNGYSLVRAIIRNAGWQLDRQVPEWERTVGEELLVPTRIYAQDVLALARSEVKVKAVSHITGGGLAANLARVMPVGAMLTVDRSTWSPNPVFSVLQELGGVGLEDAEATWNMGVGMVAVVAASDAALSIRLLQDRGVNAWQMGTVETDLADSPGRVSGTKGVQGGASRLVGTHR